MRQPSEVAIPRARAVEEGGQAWESWAREVLAGKVSLQPMEGRTIKGSEEYGWFAFCKVTW